MILVRFINLNLKSPTWLTGLLELGRHRKCVLKKVTSSFILG